MPGAAARKTRRPSYADIEALPEHLTGEIVAGELRVSPRPAPPHIYFASAMGGQLSGPFGFGRGGPGGWWILDEPELHLDVDPDYEVVVPDLAGWRRSRMRVLPQTAWFGSVPDWVCEVLSPNTAAMDRTEKMPFYARAGLAHAWLVDPLLCTLEVHRLDGDTYRVVKTFRGNVSVRAEPFDAIEIDLAPLWAVPPAPTSTPPRRTPSRRRRS